MSENGTTTRRPTIGQVARMVRIFGGTLHGDDVRGVIDIWWASGDLRRALEFAAVADGLDWAVDFRDAVKCIHDAAVLQVWAQPRDRSEFEPDRYPADRVAPQPVDESLPRNCPVCREIEWWAVPDGEARRADWHAGGHRDSHAGEAIMRDEMRGLRPVSSTTVDEPAPVHYTSPSAVIACGSPVFAGETTFATERGDVTCAACLSAMAVRGAERYADARRVDDADMMPRGSAAYNANLLNEWGI